MTTNVFKFSLITAAVIAAAGAAGWYLMSAPDGMPAAYGRIEGTTSYPGEYIPVQVVCAAPVAGGEAICAQTREGFADELVPTWALDVPPGTYYVWSSLKDPSDMGSDLGDYRAYYTAYTLCESDSCTDHTKIAVPVGSGVTVTDIRPQDWYIR